MFKEGAKYLVLTTAFGAFLLSVSFSLPVKNDEQSHEEKPVYHVYHVFDRYDGLNASLECVVNLSESSINTLKNIPLVLNQL